MVQTPQPGIESDEGCQTLLVRLPSPNRSGLIQGNLDEIGCGAQFGHSAVGGSPWGWETSRRLIHFRLAGRNQVGCQKERRAKRHRDQQKELAAIRGGIGL